jgi:hypothetical protein
MKREQIIKILKEELSVIIERVDIPGGTIIGKKIIMGKEEAADEILALPLDVPSDGEIEDRSTLYATEEGGEDLEQMLQQPDFIAFYDGAMWMRDEIINRNTLLK